MKDKRELFKLIQANYSLIPQEDFILSTEIKLRKEAQKLAKKRSYKRYSIVAASMAVCFFTFFWFAVFDGQQTITETMSAVKKDELAPAANQQEPSVYIYHTHNHESFIPELTEKDANKAFDEIKNITLVGNHLKDLLVERNINAVHETLDFERELEKRGLSYKDAYLLSRESINQALNKNHNIKMMFDIHRDNIPRKDSTVVLEGKEYARVNLFLSRSSKNYKENQAFAELIHNKLEEDYPSLSKGVIVKDSGFDSADYNQDLLNQSVLMNIGGVENTLEEEYRTAEVLADIIKELIEE